MKINDQSFPSSHNLQETRVCPVCGTSNILDQLHKREYRCAECNLELAHLDYNVNGTIRGVFGWVLASGDIVMERYQIVSVLGKGGFGASYLVDDLILGGKRRALKEVPETLFDGYETTLLSRLDHPSIPDIIERRTMNEMVYQVLKFGGSRSLGSESKQSPGRRILMEKLLPWMEQLCEVLIYLHGQNPPVIHRDIKPDNILLNEDGNIMLIDFGIAKEALPDRITRPLGRAATLGFSPPEQVMGTGTDERSDIYALGATFYALLTGHKPPAAHERVAGKELKPPSEIVPNVPPKLEESILKALSINMHHRQQSAREFLAQVFGNVTPNTLNAPLEDRTRIIYDSIASVLSSPVSLVVTHCANSEKIGYKISNIKFPFKIGAAPNMDWVIPNDDKISQEHLIIEFQNGQFTARDLGSKNGFEVNGMHVPSKIPIHIMFGDKIILPNSTVLTFILKEPVKIPDLTDQVIDGRYRLIKKIRCSEKSDLYLAEMISLSRRVALKVLSPTLTDYADYTERFEREAKIAGGLRHFHICNVLDYGETIIQRVVASELKLRYLCMEWMEGGSLVDRIVSGKPVPLLAISEWIQKLSGAFDYIHTQGVIHFGVKPSAIVFDKEGRPFLTDFAIANRLDSEKYHLVIGALDYLAPEQWEHLSSTQASDQYALAVIAYQLITGSLPYVRQDDSEVRADNFQRGPMPAHEKAASKQHRNNVPIQVSEVLARALATDPKERYVSVGAFAKALQAAIAGQKDTLSIHDERKFDTGETEPIKQTQFDVFLSYNSRNRPAVISLAKRLSAHNLNVWLDIWELRPGHPWQEAVEDVIENTRTAVVLVGSDGLGPWEDREVRACLEEFNRRKLPVIPVLLPGCPKQPSLPIFLRSFTWVDLRNEQEEEDFQRLVWGITGNKPNL